MPPHISHMGRPRDYINSAVFTMQRHASVVYAVVPVCVPQVGALLKWLNMESPKQCHTIGQGLQFSVAEDLGTTQTRSPPTEAPNTVGVS